MKRNYARYVAGWATVEASGARPEKLLCALAERGIAFWGASPPKEFSLTAEIPWRAAKLVPALGASIGCEVRVVRYHGLPAVFRKLRHRVALVVCLAFLLGLLFVSGAFVWDIRISGNETIPEGVIRQALAECGVDIGSFWPAMSQDQVRNSMILKLPDIRWMTVTIRGSHAEVIVREKRTYIEPVDEGEYVNLVAVKAGLVTEVLALRGTALTEENRTVLAGEVLVAGYATGRYGTIQGLTRAIGSVTARTWYEMTIEAPVNVDEKTSLETQTARWALILGKTRINFYKGSSICPADCDKIIEEYTLSVGGLFTLPLTVEKTVYSPYTTQSVEALELREELEAALTTALAGEIGPEGEILSARFTASGGDGVLYVTLFAECQEQIAQAVPMTAEEILEIQEKLVTIEEAEP
ncbi:MAG: sporulation protein YqfD [Oscillospiraceae bacterium]|nr:sporulation protein YqfD [Oscillospiraceae bacterium]